MLLNFGAVAWQATVWVNGRRIGTHRGGYDPFSMDITAALRRAGVQEVIVGVDAPVDRGSEPVGKQRLRPHRIWYAANSGIWQTVWLEPVPVAHIVSIRATPDVQHDTLSVTVRATGAAGDTIQTIAYQGAQQVGSAQGSATATLTLSVPNARLWSPQDPYLYGLTVRLARGGRPIDAVGSYFGMRSISVVAVGGVAKVELNGQPTFMLGTLDQGYWPDGGYTAPTPQALAYDLQVEKALGFNAVRKHMKVEPQQWYYDTDRLGLLVWQDMPALAVARPDAGAQQEFLRELHAIVNANIDHPSIVQWVPFNEGWGEFDPDQVTQDLRAWDPTRLVDTTSGYNRCTCAQSEPWRRPRPALLPQSRGPGPQRDSRHRGRRVRRARAPHPGPRMARTDLRLRTRGRLTDPHQPLRRPAHPGRPRRTPRRTERSDLHGGHGRRGRGRRTDQL